jgi:hypothetical protein
MRQREIGVRHIEFVSPRRRERIASNGGRSGRCVAGKMVITVASIQCRPKN